MPDGWRLPPDPGLGQLVTVIRASGLVRAGDSGVVLVSGGPDSVGLLAALVDLAGKEGLFALHLNYGLRDESGEDEAIVAGLCVKLGVELVIERPGLEQPGPVKGNLQAWARDARYAAAERLRRERDADWIAVGHTGSDRVETLLYRLATSPGVRPLLGMAARRGRVIRPLLGASRTDLRRSVKAAGLPFTDDRSNEDPDFARVRIRHEVMPVLRELNPGVERNIELTRAELAEDEELISGLAAEALAGKAPGSRRVPSDGDAPYGESAPRGDAAAGVEAGVLADLHPAARRRLLRQLAEERLGRNVPVTRSAAAQILRLALHPEGGRVDAGQGAFFRIEAGRVEVLPGEVEPAVGPAGLTPGDPSQAAGFLPLPGRLCTDGWTLTAELMTPPFRPRGPEVATLDLDLLAAAAAPGPELTVRRWLSGDRMRPLGMTGSRSLQDIFTDAGVPRSLRRELPVLLAGSEIAWVPGVAVSERFRLGPASAAAVRLSAERDRTAAGSPRGHSA